MHPVDAAGAHPVGGGTTLSDPRRQEQSRLVSVASLDQRIRLFDKAVGCGSCHSVYSKNAQLLVMSNDKSRLCLSCHIE
jgi:predicted CXXCH cytochrome family protein